MIDSGCPSLTAAQVVSTTNSMGSRSPNHHGSSTGAPLWFPRSSSFPTLTSFPRGDLAGYRSRRYLDNPFLYRPFQGHDFGRAKTWFSAAERTRQGAQIGSVSAKSCALDEGQRRLYGSRVSNSCCFIPDRRPEDFVVPIGTRELVPQGFELPIGNDPATCRARGAPVTAPARAGVRPAPALA